MGAQGIGLCRTEHMFLGDRRVLVERAILADDPASVPPRSEPCSSRSARTSSRCSRRWTDCRPPSACWTRRCTSSCPTAPTSWCKVARAEERGQVDEADVRLLAAVNRLHESNPMLGLRGVRLGLTLPGLFAVQIRALAEATAERLRAGGDPRPEVMVPLVGSVMELHLVRDEATALLAEVSAAEGVALDIPIGTMVELPRAALTAHRIAEVADFMSFGTNDLTQTTWGFSRDDVEASFFAAYLDNGVFTVSPFESLDRDGVGRLVALATTEGRATKPDLKIGVCGEHGGDPDSIHFFHTAGLDYVSCSPFRVPVARLEAGRAVLGRAEEDTSDDPDIQRTGGGPASTR
jgi:pyruvate,orthophosphate dikinase